MNYRVDVEYELKKAKSKFFRLSLLFSIILTLVITGDVLLILLAKDEGYLPNLIVSIIITILFLWFAIYFVFNIYRETNDKYRFYKGFDSGLKPIEEVTYLKSEEELTYMNGLYVYPIHVKYHDGLSEVDKVIYTLSDHLHYQEGDKLTIITYQRILVKAEQHS